MRNSIRLGLIALAIFCIAWTSNAQGLKPGANPPLESWSQMWNTAATGYYGTATLANLGTQKDTAAASTSINLVTSTLTPDRSGMVHPDTVIPYALAGGAGGKIQISVFTLKCTSTPSTGIKLQSSIDGTYWSDIVGDTVTLQPTSLTAPLSYTWSVNSGVGRFYRAVVTSTFFASSVWASWYYTKPTYVGQ